MPQREKNRSKRIRNSKTKIAELINNYKECLLFKKGKEIISKWLSKKKKKFTNTLKYWKIIIKQKKSLKTLKIILGFAESNTNIFENTNFLRTKNLHKTDGRGKIWTAWVLQWKETQLSELPTSSSGPHIWMWLQSIEKEGNIPSFGRLDTKKQ